MTKISVLFFGNEQLAQGIKASTPIFDALLTSDQIELYGLILPDAHTRKPFPIAVAAQKVNIPVFYTKSSAEIAQIIEQIQPQLGVLASFGKIIPQSIIDAIPHGIINIHPSLLPKYRGTTPIETALLNGDTETGVSVMRLVKAMDAGPILAQAKVSITAETTKQSLYEILATRGAQLLLDVIPAIVAQNATETAQNELEATFTSPLRKEYSKLQPVSKSALTLLHEVTAYAGFPKSKITYNSNIITVTQAHVSANSSSPLDLLCHDGQYLVIDRLIPENSKEMDTRSYFNGLKNKQ